MGAGSEWLAPEQPRLAIDQTNSLKAPDHTTSPPTHTHVLHQPPAPVLVCIHFTGPRISREQK